MPDPHAALQRIAALRQSLDDVERANVARAIDAGASLAAVGRDLGISRQAVHRRHGDSPPSGARTPRAARWRRPSGWPAGSCSPTTRGSRCAMPSRRRRRRATRCSAASTCCSRCCGRGACRARGRLTRARPHPRPRRLERLARLRARRRPPGRAGVPDLGRGRGAPARVGPHHPRAAAADGARRAGLRLGAHAGARDRRRPGRRRGGAQLRLRPRVSSGRRA